MTFTAWIVENYVENVKKYSGFQPKTRENRWV